MTAPGACLPSVLATSGSVQRSTSAATILPPGHFTTAAIRCLMQGSTTRLTTILPTATVTTAEARIHCLHGGSKSMQRLRLVLAGSGKHSASEATPSMLPADYSLVPPSPDPPLMQPPACHCIFQQPQVQLAFKLPETASGFIGYNRRQGRVNKDNPKSSLNSKKT